MDETDGHEHAPFPAELWDAADLITPMAIRVAATLGVADEIAAGTDTAAAIAAATGTDPDATGRLLAHLVTAGVVERTGDDTFGLTDLGVQLTSDHPGRGRTYLAADCALGRADLAVVDLEETVRTGEPAYPRVYGRGFWEDLAADPALSASFDEVMSAHGFDAVVAAHDWGNASHVVDVGGGDGTLLAQVLAAHPGLEGTLVELSGPAAAAVQRFADRGLGHRAHVVEASFFDPLPTTGDVYVLSGVIHDWDDPEATTILRRCAEAAGHDGTVVLVEGVRSDDREISTAMDLRMLTYVAGRERTRDELGQLAAAAELTIEDVQPVSEHSAVVVCRPAT